MECVVRRNRIPVVRECNIPILDDQDPLGLLETNPPPRPDKVPELPYKPANEPECFWYKGRIDYDADAVARAAFFNRKCNSEELDSLRFTQEVWAVAMQTAIRKGMRPEEAIAIAPPEAPEEMRMRNPEICRRILWKYWLFGYLAP